MQVEYRGFKIQAKRSFPFSDWTPDSRWHTYRIQVSKCGSLVGGMFANDIANVVDYAKLRVDYYLESSAQRQALQAS
jgi:hypothetical protein